MKAQGAASQDATQGASELPKSAAIDVVPDSRLGGAPALTHLTPCINADRLMQRALSDISCICIVWFQ